MFDYLIYYYFLSFDSAIILSYRQSQLWLPACFVFSTVLCYEQVFFWSHNSIL